MGFVCFLTSSFTKAQFCYFSQKQKTNKITTKNPIHTLAHNNRIVDLFSDNGEPEWRERIPNLSSF